VSSLPFLPPILLLGVLVALAAVRLLGEAAQRPLLMAAAGIAGGLGWQAAGLPSADPDALRIGARAGLALLVFAAAQQARLTMLPGLSLPALRLVILGVPALSAATAGTAFAVLPGLGPWSALLIGAVVPLGVGVFGERRLIAAPVGEPVKRAVRLDATFGLVLGVPLALLVEAASMPLPPFGGLADTALFASFAGAAVGGTAGLLAGRLQRAGRLGGGPLAPFGLLLAVVLACLLLGFDEVMAAAACGVLFQQEARQGGRARGALFASGRRWAAPFAFLLLGWTLGPELPGADLLVWIGALVPVLVLKAVVRGAALGGTALGDQERSFLAWFGGGPGAGAALFTVSLLGSASDAAQPLAISVAAAAVFAGLVLARAVSAPLVTRLVHATARSKKRRYGAA
jgi:NhaP-type Na+/H+ or K+/H+ antiporter